MTSFSAAWGRYWEHLTTDLRRRPSTISNYRQTLWRFNAWLAAARPAKAWHKATARDLGRFLERKPVGPRAKGPRISANTALADAAAVVGFYRWAYQTRLLGSDRLRGFTMPKGGQPSPRALPLADVRSVLVAAAGDERLSLMCWLAFAAGLRVSEISRLRVEHIALRADPPVLRVVDGKGGKDRTVPLPAALVEVLRGPLARRAAAGWLIESKQVPGRSITPRSVGVRIAEHMRAIGVQESAHSLRHSFATELLKAGKGANLYSVSRVLGHASTAVTETVYSAYGGDLAGLASQLPDPRGDRPRLAQVGLAALVPVDVADQLAAAVRVLEQHGPEVARAAETLGRATTQAWLATLGLSDPAQLAGMRAGDFPDHTDQEWAECEAALGIDRGWTLAYQLRDAIDDL